ncbi:hypothetical protein PIB30_093762 [Stylosanthes scabra]|uniref:Uncharacterized protein n=1 Tax=Stylosanthes scabra TaxID=79078 RepID=A0ABU6ZTV5_9FABA|nr:hypothetical protein [Stylosanthes scabra]
MRCIKADAVSEVGHEHVGDLAKPRPNVTRWSGKGKDEEGMVQGKRGSKRDKGRWWGSRPRLRHVGCARCMGKAKEGCWCRLGWAREWEGGMSHVGTALEGKGKGWGREGKAWIQFWCKGLRRKGACPTLVGAKDEEGCEWGDGGGFVTF